MSEDLIRRVCCNDPYAVAFVVSLGQIFQTWDDLVDRDKPVGDEQINAAFWDALGMVGNPFFLRHHDSILPVMRVAIADWFDANALARSEVPEHRAAAYVLRDTSTSSILLQCALLCGGYDHMRGISLEIRRELYDEKLEDFARG